MEVPFLIGPKSGFLAFCSEKHKSQRKKEGFVLEFFFEIHIILLVPSVVPADTLIIWIALFHNNKIL